MYKQQDGLHRLAPTEVHKRWSQAYLNYGTSERTEESTKAHTK